RTAGGPAARPCARLQPAQAGSGPAVLVGTDDGWTARSKAGVKSVPSPVGAHARRRRSAPKRRARRQRRPTSGPVRVSRLSSGEGRPGVTPGRALTGGGRAGPVFSEGAASHVYRGVALR